MTKKKKNWIDERKNQKIVAGVGVVLLIILIPSILFGGDAGDFKNYTYIPPTTTTRPPCGSECVTSGEWNAADLKHDIGHLGVDGSWESDVDGFGYLVGSIYIPLKAGSYKVVYEMRINDNTRNEKAVYIEVARNYGVPVLGFQVNASEFKQIGVYQNFTLNLVSGDLTDADFRVHYNHGKEIVNINKIYLIPS